MRNKEFSIVAVSAVLAVLLTCGCQKNHARTSSNGSIPMLCVSAGPGGSLSGPGVGSSANNCAVLTPGSNVTLTAAPLSSAYAFAGWANVPGSCSATTTKCVFPMPASQTNVTAYFSQGGIVYYYLDVNVNGGGTVTSSYPSANTLVGINPLIVRAGQSVTLTASPNTGYSFEGWNNHDQCNGSTSPTCVVQMTGNAIADAAFSQKAVVFYLLTVDGSSGGTITSSVGGITEDGTTESVQLLAGTQVTLTATPNAGKTFAGWNIYGCAGTGSCTVTMNQDETFSPQTFN